MNHNLSKHHLPVLCDIAQIVLDDWPDQAARGGGVPISNQPS